MNPSPDSGHGAGVAEGEHLDVELVTSAFVDGLAPAFETQVFRHLAAACLPCRQCLDEVAEQEPKRWRASNAGPVTRALHCLDRTHPRRPDTTLKLDRLMPGHRLAACAARDHGSGFARLVIEEARTPWLERSNPTHESLERACELVHSLPSDLIASGGRWADALTVLFAYRAIVAAESGEPDMAHAYLAKARETLAEASGDPEVRSLVLEVEGHWLIGTDRPEEGLARLREAGELLREAHHERPDLSGRLAEVLFYQGIRFDQEREIPAAADRYQEALFYLPEGKSPTLWLWLKHALARCELALGNTIAARRTLSNTSRTCYSVGDTWLRAEHDRLRGDLLLQEGETENARYRYHEALKRYLRLLALPETAEMLFAYYRLCPGGEWQTERRDAIEMMRQLADQPEWRDVLAEKAREFLARYAGEAYPELEEEIKRFFAHQQEVF